MNAREVIAQAISPDLVVMPGDVDIIAVDVLAALREHWTSDNTIRNAIAESLARFDARIHASDADRKAAQDAARAVIDALLGEAP